jgi:choline dehydrogenase
VQLHFLPVLDNFDNTPGEKPAASEHGLTIKVGHLQPKSRGQVLLRSRHPEDLVKIDANFLSHPDDLAGQVRAVQVGLKMMQTAALRDVTREVTVPHNIDWRDVPALEDFVRQNIKTVYHPAGTCRMGQSPQDAVTDLSLRVHGIAGLRVIDCSICPQVPSGNTNAPSIMIGERGADLLLGKALPPQMPANITGHALALP